MRAYGRRRVLRIVPAYWVALVLLALWPGIVAFWGGPWWRSFTFTQIYWRNSTTQGIFPAWTLCIEISFYLALPFVAPAIAVVWYAGVSMYRRSQGISLANTFKEIPPE